MAGARGSAGAMIPANSAGRHRPRRHLGVAPERAPQHHHEEGGRLPPPRQWSAQGRVRERYLLSGRLSRRGRHYRRNCSRLDFSHLCWH